MVFAHLRKLQALMSEETPKQSPAQMRHEIRLEGVISAVQTQARATSCDLVVTLADELTSLVWWGREAIPGLTPGQRIAAYGRTSMYRGRIALLNPAYELMETPHVA